MAKKDRARVIGDTHWGHKGITQFMRSDGSPVRPWDTPEEMDEAMVAAWNAVTGEHDRVYLVGDVAINKRALPILERLNGKLVLISGNHDIFGAKEYLKYFEDVRGYKVVDGEGGPRAILSHIPIHEQCLGRFVVNIHGHLHTNQITVDEDIYDGLATPPSIMRVPDPRYVCVSAEQVGYAPVLLEDVIAKAHAAIGYVDGVEVVKLNGPD